MQEAVAPIPADYSARIRSVRKCRKLTQTQLAKHIGVSFCAVNRWENGQSRPSRLAWLQILDLENGSSGAATVRSSSSPARSAPRDLEGALQADIQARLARLLGASPSIIYSFKASGDFKPTFVSENIEALFGYVPKDYLENPTFWSDRVHPDDIDRVD